MSAPSPDLIARLRAALDRDAATDLLRRVVQAASVTGDEAAAVAALRPELARLGLSPVVAEFAPGRPNLSGGRGGPDGPRLLFMGHTDVVHARGWKDRWAGAPQEDPFGAAILDGELWGRGAADLKAGICAALGAIDLLDRAGVKLRGAIDVAFVGDEESGEPGTGVSAGARAWTEAVRAGAFPRPDFAIYVEPSRLSVFPVQIGFFIAEVTLTGRSAYFGRSELGVDALKAAHGVLSAIWAHSDAIAARAEHPLLGQAFALVTGLEAGGLIAVPGECRFSLIRKLLPGETLDAATAELEAAIRAATPADVGLSIAYPAGRDHPRGGSPSGVAPDHPTAAALAACLAAVRPGAGAIEGAPFWSEMPFLIEGVGCPAVYCAPGDISICHTFEERVPLDDYFDAIVAFAAFAAGFCGTVDEDGSDPGRDR
jgi:acetylornithine deacetylase/succinyl-diaminopimelate desuccinylase-like protein